MKKWLDGGAASGEESILFVALGLGELGWVFFFFFTGGGIYPWDEAEATARKNDLEERKSLGRWARNPKKGASEGEGADQIKLCGDDLYLGSRGVRKLFKGMALLSLLAWDVGEAERRLPVGCFLSGRKMEPSGDWGFSKKSKTKRNYFELHFVILSATLTFCFPLGNV